MKSLTLVIWMAALVVSSSAVGAESRSYWSSSNWDVDAYPTNCMATTASELKDDGVSVFGLYYDAKEKFLTVNFSSTMTTSLEDDSKVNAELLFANTRSDTIDDGWGEPEFTVKKMDDGGTLFILKIKADAIQTMLDDISANDYVALQKNETIFAGAQLDGSAQAMKQLKSCAFGIAGLNPRDPFAQ